MERLHTKITWLPIGSLGPNWAGENATKTSQKAMFKGTRSYLACDTESKKSCFSLEERRRKLR